MQGSAINRMDVRLQRRFNFGRAYVDLMLEVFNLFNTENYGSYQGFASHARYGQPNPNPDVAYWPRIMQLGFRLAF